MQKSHCTIHCFLILLQKIDEKGLNMLKSSRFLITAFISLNTSAQNTSYQGFSYPDNASNAISITFDDARHSQVDNGLSLLNKYKVKATFYVSPFNVEERVSKWQKVVKDGHEIANHTNKHLCTGNFEWLRQQGLSLEQASLKDIEKDIIDSQQYIKRTLGVDAKAFAYPCGNTFVGRGANTKSYVPLIAKHFDTGRTWLDETANNPNFTDFSQLTSLRIDGLTFAEIKAMIEQHRTNNSWIILAGHEIGERGQYSTDINALEELINYLQKPETGYWLETVSEVSSYIKQHRKDLQ